MFWSDYVFQHSIAIACINCSVFLFEAPPKLSLSVSLMCSVGQSVRADLQWQVSSLLYIYLLLRFSVCYINQSDIRNIPNYKL